MFNVSLAITIAKNISGHLDALDEEFNRIISNLCGDNIASRLLQQSMNGNESESVIVISDDEDDENNTASNPNSNRLESLSPPRSSPPTIELSAIL